MKTNPNNFAEMLLDDGTTIKRIVVTAANRSKRHGLIITGVRHWCPLMQDQFEALKPELAHRTDWEQGFVDQYGQYLTREDAYYIVRVNEQPTRFPLGTHSNKELFSEDLH